MSLKTTKMQVLRLASLAEDDNVLGWVNSSTHKQLLFLGSFAARRISNSSEKGDPGQIALQHSIQDCSSKVALRKSFLVAAPILALGNNGRPTPFAGIPRLWPGSGHLMFCSIRFGRTNTQHEGRPRGRSPQGPNACVRAAYFVAATTKAALAAFAALFFSRLTLAQRLC